MKNRQLFKMEAEFSATLAGDNVKKFLDAIQYPTMNADNETIYDAFVRLHEISPAQAKAAFTHLDKYLALIISLNPHFFHTFVPAKIGRPLIEPFLPYFFANSLEALEEGYQCALLQNKGEKDGELLHAGAVALDPDNFAKLCSWMGLELGSEKYIHYILNHKGVFFELPPVLVAIYCNNISLLRFIDQTTGGKLKDSLGLRLGVKDGIVSRAAMHFAAMGGACEVLVYLHHKWNMPYNVCDSDGMTSYSLSVLSGDWAITDILKAQDYQPNSLEFSNTEGFLNIHPIFKFYEVEKSIPGTDIVIAPKSLTKFPMPLEEMFKSEERVLQDGNIKELKEMVARVVGRAQRSHSMPPPVFKPSFFSGADEREVKIEEKGGEKKSIPPRV